MKSKPYASHYLMQFLSKRRQYPIKPKPFGFVAFSHERDSMGKLIKDSSPRRYRRLSCRKSSFVNLSCNFGYDTIAATNSQQIQQCSFRYDLPKTDKSTSTVRASTLEPAKVITLPEVKTRKYDESPRSKGLGSAMAEKEKRLYKYWSKLV
jgi:hypothetical protein